MNDIDEIRQELRQIHQTTARVSGMQQSLQSQFESLSIRLNHGAQVVDVEGKMQELDARMESINTRLETLGIDTLSEELVAVMEELSWREVRDPLTQRVESLERDRLLYIAELRRLQDAINALKNNKPEPWYRRLFK